MHVFTTVLSGIAAGLAVCLLMTEPADAGQDDPAPEHGFLSEIRLGALRHDAGVIVAQEEPDVVDANAELLFASPRFLRHVWSPRPHLGVIGNFAGATNQAYLGLTWDVDLFAGLFLELGLGASVHNGELDTGDQARKNLGCRWLYRESVSLGYRVSQHHNVSVMLDHVSNNDRCDRNDGLDTLGVRWGYRF